MSITEIDYESAVSVVLESSNASCSHLQRKLNWGYARASSAIDRMEGEFIVGPMSTTGKRDVLPPCVHELWVKAQQQEKEIEALKEFKELYRRAIVNAEKPKDIRNWVHVARLGVGAGKAKMLCTMFGVDLHGTNIHIALDEQEQSHE